MTLLVAVGCLLAGAVVAIIIELRTRNPRAALFGFFTTVIVCALGALVQWAAMGGW